jgi:MATE family multidrug resistance protein
MYVLAAGTVFCAVTAPLNWLLIFRLGWGLDGSAAAAVAAEAVYAAALAAACVLHNRRQPLGERWWAGWSRQALRDWGPFLRLSAAATAMIVADWWAYDILTLLAGLLPSPDVPLAATGIIYNLNTIIFMAPFGLSYAVCARVGHHLGGARPRAAKLAGGAFSGLFVHACSAMHAGHACMHNCSAWLLASALVCARAQQFTDAPACLPACLPARLPAAEIGTAMGMLASGLAALLLLLSRDSAPALFTSDPAVIQACSVLMLPLAALLLSEFAGCKRAGCLPARLGIVCWRIFSRQATVGVRC